MSGFVAVVNRDGAPIDPSLIDALTRSLSVRGPDAQQIWCSGNVGFGHTLLRTAFEAEHEKQPCTIDGQSWITADCRLDARQDLIGELVANGRPLAPAVTNPELILHAWAVWGPDCVHHLLGDFAFAIWDTRHQLLFCARDHMGLKPFYYSYKGNCLIVGNTLNCLRLHPAVSRAINDSAIADFLLFGYNLDVSVTSFEDIQRLPAAHTLTWSAGDSTLRIARYWSIPIDPPLRYRRDREYEEHFLDLFRTVTRDRLQCDSAAFMMSGGLDSTSVAAMVKELADQRPSLRLKAHTIVYDKIMPDRERHFAGLAAAGIGIPIQFHPWDDSGILEAGRDLTTPIPDPAFIPYFGPKLSGGIYADMASESRTVFYGEGLDNALDYDWKPWVRYELAQRNFPTLAKALASFVFQFRQIPFWTRITRSVRQRPSMADGEVLPPWLNPDFVARLHLRERFDRGNREPDNPSAQHPIHPRGYDSFHSCLWPALFEGYDPGVTGLPVEFRYPYLDIRMIRFLLSVPPVPWSRNKYLVRRSMRNHLPAEVLARPKTGLVAFPGFEVWKRKGLPDFLPTDLLETYVNVPVLKDLPIDSHHTFGLKLRPSIVSFFLRSLDLK